MGFFGSKYFRARGEGKTWKDEARTRG